MFLSSLLTLTLLTPDADAGNDPKIKNVRVRQNTDTSGSSSSAAGSRPRVLNVSGGSDAHYGPLWDNLEMEVGGETIDMVLADLALHGAAPVDQLPVRDATVSLVLSDAAGEPLATFSGGLSPDGSGYLTADAEFTDTSPDIEVLVLEAFSAEVGGYELAVDINGADVSDVVFGELTLTEVTGREEVCVSTDEMGNCLEFQVVTSATTTTSDLAFDAASTVWEAELPDLTGLLDIKVRAYDERGRKVETAKVKLGLPWDDGAAGVSALATDDDPLTTIGTFVADEGRVLAVVSDGWSLGGTLPTTAMIELTGGETLSVPANSYQLALVEALTFDVDPDTLDELVLSVDGGALGCLKTGPGTYTCKCRASYCATLQSDTDDQWWLSLSAYGASVSELPSGATVTVTDIDGGLLTAADAYDVVFDDEVGVVFAYTVSLAEDPIGLDLGGRVSLLGAGNGHSFHLARARFHGRLVRDEDGEIALAGRDKDAVVARGDILIGGEPVDIEISYDPETGESTATVPPVVVRMSYSNGKGTRNAATSNHGKPGLL